MDLPVRDSPLDNETNCLTGTESLKLAKIVSLGEVIRKKWPMVVSAIIVVVCTIMFLLAYKAVFERRKVLVQCITHSPPL